MHEPKDGGPAFPRIEVEHFAGGYGHGPHCETQNMPGMSLRDYFAAQAMTVLVKEESFGQGESSVRIDVARCYRIADAMLAERAK